MANPYDAVFRDDNSETRLSGKIDFTDSGNQPGAPVITRGTYTLAGTALGAGSDRDLTWAYASGDHLLDLTDPVNPLPLTSGVYAVTYCCTPSAVVSATAVFQTGGDIDDNNLSPIFRNTGPMVVGLSGQVGVSCTFYCPSNSPIRAWCRHTDAGQSPNVDGVAIVQRVT